MTGKLDTQEYDVLFVEDNPNDVELALYSFRRMGLDQRVKVLRDGEQALEFLRAAGASSRSGSSILPRLVLLDIKLPKVTGLEVLKAIKDDPAIKCLPVVMFSSSAQESDVTTAYELGANSYIVKPVEFERFSKLIECACEYWLMANQPPFEK